MKLSDVYCSVIFDVVLCVSALYTPKEYREEDWKRGILSRRISVGLMILILFLYLAKMMDYSRKMFFVFLLCEYFFGNCFT